MLREQNPSCVLALLLRRVGVKCWGQNIWLALIQKNLVSNHNKAFPGVPPLVRVLFHLLLFSRVSLSDWVVWNFSCGYDPFR